MKTNSATPQVLNLAAQIVAHEATIGAFAGVMTPAAFRVCEKLRRTLTALAGSAGFHSLLSRALVVAQREIPSLSDVRVGADGSLEAGIIHTQIAQDRKVRGVQDKNAKGGDGGLLLAAEFLGLLHIFIGEAMTLRLVRIIWPSASVSAWEPEGKNEHEP
jgi:hypothetical protein